MKDFDRSSAQSNWPELTTASTVNLINCDRNITATCNKITDSVLYLNIVHSPPKIRQVSFQLQIIRFSEFTSGSYTADGNHSIESPRLLYAYLPHTHTVWESFSVYCHFARPEKKNPFFRRQSFASASILLFFECEKLFRAPDLFSRFWVIFRSEQKKNI